MVVAQKRSINGHDGKVSAFIDNELVMLAEHILFSSQIFQTLISFTLNTDIYRWGSCVCKKLSQIAFKSILNNEPKSFILYNEFTQLH